MGGTHSTAQPLVLGLLAQFRKVLVGDCLDDNRVHGVLLELDHAAKVVPGRA